MSSDENTWKLTVEGNEVLTARFKFVIPEIQKLHDSEKRILIRMIQHDLGQVEE